MRDICYKCEFHKLESNNFSNTLVFNGLLIAFHTFTINCLRGLVVSVEDSCFGGRGFEPQQNLLLCGLYFIFLLMDSVYRIV